MSRSPVRERPVTLIAHVFELDHRGLGEQVGHRQRAGDVEHRALAPDPHRLQARGQRGTHVARDLLVVPQGGDHLRDLRHQVRQRRVGLGRIACGQAGVRVRPEVPAAIGVDGVQAALEDLRQWRPHPECSAERRAHEVEVFGDGDARRHLERVEQQRPHACLACGEHPDPPPEGAMGDQSAVLGLRRLDDEERHARGVGLGQH